MNGTEFARRNGSYSTAVIGTWQLIGQDKGANTSTIRVYLYFYYGGSTSVGSTISGATFGAMGQTFKTGSYRYYPGYTLLGYTDITISHNADGSFPGVSLGFWSYSYHFQPNQETWGSAGARSVPSIPRYANFTKHYIESTTEDSITVYWNSDANCNGLQYSLNGGSWTDVSGWPSYTIKGLKGGTSYNVRTRIKRSDSGLWTESGTLSAITKDYVVRLNVNGTWKKGVPYIKMNGAWKKTIPYVKVNGAWKKGV